MNILSLINQYLDNYYQIKTKLLQYDETFTMQILAPKFGKSIPTVWQIGFAFMYLQKSVKISYPTVWQLGFAISLTWQIDG
jgi:hypothetical protein